MMPSINSERRLKANEVLEFKCQSRLGRGKHTLVSHASDAESTHSALRYRARLQASFEHARVWRKLTG
eukprot:2248377-Amphidinium_carterae.1